MDDDDISETIGLPGFVRYGGRVYEEWHPRLQGQLGVRVYREMRDNDATIGAALNLTNNVLRQVPWHAEPADGSEEAKAWAEFLEDCLDDMQGTWEDFMSEVLSMLWFGWSLFEKTYKKRGDGRIGVDSIEIRAQETLDDWLYEGNDLVGFWQSASPLYQRVLIPIEKCILFRTESNKGSPEGRSLLRNAYRAWYFLKRLQELEAVGIERDLVGLPVIELPPAYLEANAPAEKKSARAAFERMIQQIRRNDHEGLLFPAELDREGKPTQFKLRLLASGGSRQIDVSTPIQRYQREIAMNFSTQFQMLGSAGSSGSWALSSDQTDMYGLSLGAILDSVEDTFNRFFVRELFALNGVPVELTPRFVHGDIERRDVSKFTESITSLVDAGVVTPDPSLEAHVREEVGLPPIDDGMEDEAAAPVLDVGAEVEKGAGHVPPSDATRTAANALEARAQKTSKGRGLSVVGLATAGLIATGQGLSRAAVDRLHDYFTRHLDDRSAPHGSPKWQEWNGRGGDAGAAWVAGIVGDTGGACGCD